MDSNTIKPIETHYAGCRFRSRTEARWAVFFDALDIRWVYEEEGYWLPRVRESYLPDFWLPQVSMFAEVKHFGGFTDEAMKLCWALARHSGHDILLCDGVPAHVWYWATLAPQGPDHEYAYVSLDLFNGKRYHLSESRFFTGDIECPGAFCPPAPEVDAFLASDDRGAVTAARSARFEHGESG